MDVLGADALQNGLDGALQGEEVHAAIGAQGQNLCLHGQTVHAAGEIDAAKLIQPHGSVAVVVVVAQHLQHRGHGGGAHDGGVLPQRIQNLEGAAVGIIFIPENFVVSGGRDEGVGDDFAVSAGAAQRAQLIFQLLNGGIAPLGGLAPHEGGGDVIVAVEPGHLLRQIGHAAHVPPPGGNGRLIALHAKAQLGENGDHLLLRDAGAQQGVDFVRLQGQDGGLGDEV